MLARIRASSRTRAGVSIPLRSNDVMATPGRLRWQQHTGLARRRRCHAAPNAGRGAPDLGPKRGQVYFCCELLAGSGPPQFLAPRIGSAPDRTPVTHEHIVLRLLL